MDGEAVGYTLYGLDLLEVKGHDIRVHAYLSRFAGLLPSWIPSNGTSAPWTHK